MSNSATWKILLRRALSISVVIGAVMAAYFGGYYFAASTKPSSGPASIAALGKQPERLSNSATSAWDLPSFSLPDLDDQLHSLVEWKGKVIMLNFWATWCPPCQDEIPDFISYQNDYGAKGLQIVGVGIDEKHKLNNFVRRIGINYPVLVANGTVSDKVMADWGNNVNMLPYTVIIDRDGLIIYIQRGQFGDEEFEEIVLPLLG